MIRPDPIRRATDSQLQRWLREACAAGAVTLPDCSPVDQVRDLVWLDRFGAACRAELERRGVAAQRRTGTS